MHQQSRLVTALRHHLNSERQLALLAWREHLRPDALLGNLRRIADNTVRQLLKIHPLPKGACIAAVGGYGRGELYPYSDLDIVILLPAEATQTEQHNIAKLVAALWDLGMEPGHSVRTISQCRHEAAADITVQTSLLEARFIAGSKKLFKSFSEHMQLDLNPRQFFLDKRAEMKLRHARHQNTAYSLEPNCKEAPGGLRDLQVLLWLARAAGFGTNWRAIAKTGLLSKQEFISLRRAEQAFKRLRIELHILAGRREDRVLFDLQPRLANVYGFKDTATRRASELLMQRYYWAAKVVSQINRILMLSLEEFLFPTATEQCQQLDDDFGVLRQRLVLMRAEAFNQQPELMLRAFLVMQQNPQLQGMGASTLRAMWHARHKIDRSFRDKAHNKLLFLQILQQPRGIVHALRDMSLWNVLPKYLPPFRRIVGQMQHDLFHAYTVDQHILMVISNLYRFTQAEYAQEYPLASQLMAEMDKPWLLYIAALFHDIAKGRGGDHSVLGAAEVRRFARKHGLDQEDLELLVFLVREHLSLSLVAQKRDLSDPQVIHDFALRMGNQTRLAALYLLTVADLRGTAPNIWNNWKGKLLEELYHKALAALGGPRPDTSTVLALRKELAAAEIRRQGLRDETRLAFWQQLDVAYFLRHDANEIAWHTRQLYAADQQQAVVKTRITAASDALQVLVYAQDRTDLFADICKYFDHFDIGIQDARIHTTNKNWALDSFIVLMPNKNDDMRAQAALLEHGLQAMLNNELELKSKAKVKRRLRSRRSIVFPVMPNINLSPDSEQHTWRLSITCADRQGLLYDLACVFTRHEITLLMAKIMTLGGMVEDLFILKGQHLTKPLAQRRFEREILDTL